MVSVTCKPGYFGQFCKKSCPVGTYGPGCAGICKPHCSDTGCDHIIGCTQKTGVFHSVTKPSSSYKLQTTTTGFTSHSKENTKFVTVEPVIENEFRAVYLFVGLCVIIGILIFINIIQRCRKSMPLKTHLVKQQGCVDEETTQGESSNRDSQRRYHVISEQLQDHSYRSLEDQYADVDESAELHILYSSAENDRFETVESPNIEVHTTDGYRHIVKTVSVEDFEEDLKESVDAFDLYLKPI